MEQTPEQAVTKVLSCRVTKQTMNFQQSLTKAVYNVATACSVHKEYGNFSTELALSGKN